LMMKNGLRAGGVGMPGGPPFSESLEGTLAGFDLAGRGAFALEQGFIFTAMILAAVTAEIIDRRFARAAAWCCAAAALSFVGLMHAYVWTPGDTVVALGLGTGIVWCAAYLIAAAILAIVPSITTEGEGGH
jgi:AGZA family xanthine/uracil permease-like MFS transporter